jgi:hypothetical protein
MPAKRRQQVSEPDHRTQDPNPPQQRRPPDSHTEADLRDDRLQARARLDRMRAGCGIPSTSPRGYHTTTRGQRDTRPPPVASRAAPGSPRGRATPGRRDATRVPASKIIRDRSVSRNLSRPPGTPPHGPTWNRTMIKYLQGDRHRARTTRGNDGKETPGPALGRRTSGSIENAWRSSESIPPSQPRRVRRLAKCGADELACKPDPVASQAHDQLRAACC